MRSSVRSLTWCAALALLGGLLAPAAARAGCGDYVMVGGHAPREAHGPDRDAPPAPCTGPQCSRPTERTSVPAPAPSTNESRGAACVTGIAAVVDDPAPRHDLSEPLHVTAEGARDPIYHPPR